MRVSIGILAYNEEAVIQATIAAIRRQSLLYDADRLNVSALEIIVVPNGCTDSTSRRATEAVVSAAWPTRVNVRIVDLSEAGKSRTWNRYVHELSDRDADFLILMDADTEFATDDVLEFLLHELIINADIQVSTDLPLKHVAKLDQRSLADKVSLLTSSLNVSDSAIAGSLYCARTQTLRQIWMPLTLPVEDGFLRAMIVTQGFTQKEDTRRVKRLVHKHHYFQSHRNVRSFLRHETRIIVGSVVNYHLFSLLWREGKSGHVGQFIRGANERDPSWLDKLVASESKGLWRVPASFVSKRFRVAEPRRTPRARLLAFLAGLLGVVASVRANGVLLRGSASSYW